MASPAHSPVPAAASRPSRRRVAIVIPCRNEERHIAECLESVLRFEVPPGTELEILLYDGGSTDRTPAIAQEFARTHPQVRWHENPRRYQAAAVNLAVGSSQADFFLWLGAHTHFPREYIRLCLETADRTGADVVGGFCITLPGGSGYGAQVVQAMTTHKFGVGDSGFRVGAKEGPVDTVAYALFRSSVFARVGLLDERLVRAQDFEFNCRIRRAGLTIWFNPAIQCQYHNQASLLAFYRKQIVLEAPYNAYMWWVAPYSFTPRHAISAAFALGVVSGAAVAPLTPFLAVPYLGVLGLYAVLAVASAIQQAARFRQPAHVLTLPVCFFLYHFLHGVGVLAGVARILTRTAPVQRASRPPDVTGSRKP